MLSKPNHQKVYDFIFDKIRSNEINEGDLLPSENDLCEKFSVTRPTVRQALAKLEYQGFIKKHHGKGSIVLGPKKGLGILSVKGTSKSLGDEMITTIIIEKPSLIDWPKDFFYPLSEVEANSPCIYFERQRLIKDEVVIFEQTYLSSAKVPKFVGVNLENKSLFSELKALYNIEIKGGEQKIKAILPDNRLQQFLKVPADKPVLMFERKIATSRDGFYIYSVVFCNSEKYYIEGTF